MGTLFAIPSASDAKKNWESSQAYKREQREKQAKRKATQLALKIVKTFLNSNQSCIRMIIETGGTDKSRERNEPQFRFEFPEYLDELCSEIKKLGYYACATEPLQCAFSAGFYFSYLRISFDLSTYNPNR